MFERIRRRLPIALSILAIGLTLVPALAHGVKHARYAHKAGMARNANNLDGRDSTEFASAGHDHDEAYYAQGSKVDDSDKLDGDDSSVFREYLQHASQPASDCDAEGDNLCAPVTVIVPEGERYRISIWSEISLLGPGSSVTVDYCSARLGSDFEHEGTIPSCVTPFAVRQRVSVPAGQYVAASSSGETTFIPDPGGASGHTFTAGTLLDPSAALGNDTTRALVITKVRVWDADSDAGACPGGTLC